MPRITKSLFRMPAEWERQQSTLMGWTYNKNDWPGKFNNIPKIFAEINSSLPLGPKISKVSVLFCIDIVCNNPKIPTQ